MSETVRLEVADGVATLTLDRPEKLNAISPQLRDDLEAGLEEVRFDDAVRVVRVRGAGRGFCSGYDLSSGSSVYSMAPVEQEPAPAAGERGASARPAPHELPASQLIRDRERLRDNIERWLRMWSYRKPVVAQVHGVCLAGGLDLIGVCDLVHAATDARFGHPAARGLGIPPTLGLLPARIGLARTKQLLFTGDLVDGVRAERIGLVDEVHDPERLDEEVFAACARMARTPGDALTLHKHVVNRWAETMGTRLAALEGADFDAMFHLLPASSEFGRIAAEDGLREALRWRDEPFAD